MPNLILDPNQIITEIAANEEETRRSHMVQRHSIFHDGGLEILTEKIRREFGADSVKEMRLCPINFLKKIINKKSAVYKTPPVRTAQGANKKDQALIDFYVEDLALDRVMAKANRYLNLFANTAIYPFLTTNKKDETMKPTVEVIPPHQYSVVVNPIKKTEPLVWVFNEFIEKDRVFSEAQPPAATGVEGFSRDRGFKHGSKDIIESGEKIDDTEGRRRFIVWSDEEHFTMDSKGKVLAVLDKNDDQFKNPFGRAPVVNLARDRDNQFWSPEGEDMTNLTMLLQQGWSDLMTISKNQGFAVLTVIGEEKPDEITVGINKGVFLKATAGGVTPTIGYISANSDLASYKANLMDLLALLLSTNDMSSRSIAGKGEAQSFTSGFDRMLEMSDALEAVEKDKPVMRDAERDTWEILKLEHNWALENDLLPQSHKELGKFSDDFGIDITYPDIKPIESAKEKEESVDRRMKMGLMTRAQALKKLEPDLSEEGVTNHLQEIEDENTARQKNFMDNLPTPKKESDEKPKDIDEDGEKE